MPQRTGTETVCGIKWWPLSHHGWSWLLLSLRAARWTLSLGMVPSLKETSQSLIIASRSHWTPSPLEEAGICSSWSCYLLWRCVCLPRPECLHQFHHWRDNSVWLTKQDPTSHASAQGRPFTEMKGWLLLPNISVSRGSHSLRMKEWPVTGPAEVPS